MDFVRSGHRYKSIADRQEFLGIRLRDLTLSSINYDYHRLHILPTREGWQINRKRVYRIYK